MASVNSLQSIQAWQETRSIFLRTFFLQYYFAFPCTFLVCQKFSKMEISDVHLRFSSRVKPRGIMEQRARRFMALAGRWDTYISLKVI